MDSLFAAQVVGVVIIFNTITIGYEIQARIDQDDTTLFLYLEYVYLFIYGAELGLRFFAYHLSCLSSPWVRLDCFLVFLSVFGLFFEPMLTRMMQDPMLSRGIGAPHMFI